ncbi:MAG: GAF domain-containing protein [Halolamina sp.]
MSDGNIPVDALTAAVSRLSDATTVEEVAEVTVDAATTLVSLPAVGVHLDRDGRLEPVATTQAVPELLGERPTYTPENELIWRLYEAEETMMTPDVDVDRTPVRSCVVVALEGHGVLIASSERANAYDPTAAELLTVLAANAGAALDRLDRERRLDRLHRATRRLMNAPDCEAVASLAVETARDVVGLDVNAVYVYDGSEFEGLIPIAETAKSKTLFDGAPRLRAGESIAWRCFETGEPYVDDDVLSDAGAQNPETPIRSELIFPLGDHGVFIAGSQVREAFDDGTVSVAAVLADNVEAAMDRASREADVHRREAELARQNERLEEFAAVVSHDLRSPLSAARGHLDLLETHVSEDGRDHFDAVAGAHDRIDELIGDLLSLARQGKTVGDTARLDLGEVVGAAAADVGISPTVDDLGTVEADRGRLRELLVNLFANARAHGGDEIRVGSVDGGGFYVADDGPGLPTEVDVFERGLTTADEGTGFGLSIVRCIAEAHSWTVSATTDPDLGGARFVVDTDPEERPE